jgi:hypothetical protein
MAKPKVIDLPGIEGKGVAPLRIADVDKLAEAYVRERDKRLKMTPREVAAKQNLIAALHAHDKEIRQSDGKLVYRYDEMVITLTPGKEKLKVEPYEEEELD